jgi:hypothetical protein
MFSQNARIIPRDTLPSSVNDINKYKKKLHFFALNISASLTAARISGMENMVRACAKQSLAKCIVMQIKYEINIFSSENIGQRHFYLDVVQNCVCSTDGTW